MVDTEVETFWDESETVEHKEMESHRESFRAGFRAARTRGNPTEPLSNTSESVIDEIFDRWWDREKK